MDTEVLLRAPCVFCGYNGERYYQRGSHSPDCPWHDVGGLRDRVDSLRDVIRERSRSGNPEDGA